MATAESGKATSEYRLTQIVLAFGALMTGGGVVAPDSVMTERLRELLVEMGMVIMLVQAIVYAIARTWRKVRAEGVSAILSDPSMTEELRNVVEDLRKHFTKPPAAAILLACMLFVSACNFTPKAYDPATTRRIDETVSFLRDDHALTRAALLDLDAPPIVLNSLDTRLEAALQRMKTWRFAEESKRDDEEVK